MTHPVRVIVGQTCCIQGLVLVVTVAQEGNIYKLGIFQNQSVLLTVGPVRP